MEISLEKAVDKKGIFLKFQQQKRTPFLKEIPPLPPSPLRTNKIHIGFLSESPLSMYFDILEKEINPKNQAIPKPKIIGKDPKTGGKIFQAQEVYHCIRYPRGSPQLKKAWNNLIKKGAKTWELVYHVGLSDVGYQHNRELQEWGKEVDKIALRSLEHYRAIERHIGRDRGFYSPTKEAVLNEIKENIEFLRFVRDAITYSSKLCKSIGLDKKPSVNLQKHKIWEKTILGLTRYINKFYHTECCYRNCRTIHKKAIRDVVILLKAYYPTIWNEPIPTIEGKIKARIYRSHSL